MGNFKKLIIIVTVVFGVSCNMKSAYIVNDEQKNSLSSEVGYLFGSIGRVYVPNLDCRMPNNHIILEKKGTNKTITLISNMKDIGASPIDYNTLEFSAGMFYVPLEEGEYEIIGVEHFGIKVSPVFVPTSNKVGYENKEKLRVPLIIKKGEVTYIGEYLAYKGCRFIVSDKRDRDQKIIQEKENKEIEINKIQIPKFSGVASSYFKIVDEEFFDKIKEYRIEQAKKFLDEL